MSNQKSIPRLKSKHMTIFVIVIFSLAFLLFVNVWRSKFNGTSSSALLLDKDNVDMDDMETIMHGDQRVRKFFFVGVPSTCSEVGNTRRSAIRHHMSQYSNIADVRFFVDRVEHYLAKPPRQCDVILRHEQEQYHDIVFTSSLESQQGPQALIYKTDSILFYMASSPYKYRFLMKMDDDSLVLVDRFKEQLEETIDKPFIQQHSWLNSQSALRKSVVSYAGYFLGRSTVLNSNPRFKSDTGLEFYPMYAQGSTYCISSRLVEALYKLSQQVELTKWGSEDTTMGFRILSLKHTRVHLTDQYVFAGYENCGPQTLVFHPIKKADKLLLASNVVYQNITRACEIFLESNARPKPKPKPAPAATERSVEQPQE